MVQVQSGLQNNPNWRGFTISDAREKAQRPLEYREKTIL